MPYAGRMYKPLDLLRIPGQYLGIFEAFAVQRGIGVESLRAATDLGPGSPGPRDQDLEGPQFLRLMAWARQVADPERPLSVQLLDHVPLTAHGTMGIVVLTSANLGAALELALRFHPLVMPACELRREDRTDAVVLELHWLYDFGAQADTLTEMVLGAFNRIRPHLPPTTGLLQLSLRHSPHFPPESYTPLGEAGCIEFDQSRDALHIPRQWLGLPLLTASPSTLRQFLPGLEAQLHAQQGGQEVTEALRHRLMQRLRQGQTLAIDVVAATLAMSSRTLGRRLAQEGGTYRSLVNEVRLQHAEHLLRTTRKPISQVARAAGFDNDSSFARAFRRRHGIPPSQLRR